MVVVLAAVAGSAFGLGLVLLWAGFTTAPKKSTEVSTGLWVSAISWWTKLPSKQRWWLALSGSTGFIAALLTGWLLWLPITPLALVAVPMLLSAPPQREIEILAGLDRWTRLIATSLSSGRSVRDAILATRRQTPPVLAEAVNRLCGRLSQRWPLRDALREMADELDCADADAVLAALIIAGSRGGQGARAALETLSDTVQDRLRSLRTVASERAKPRVVIRQVTVISVATIILASVLNPRFFAPYASPTGQLIAAVLVGVFLWCLVMIRRRTIPPAAPRFLKARA